MSIKNLLKRLVNKRNHAEIVQNEPSGKTDMFFRDYIIRYLKGLDGETRSRTYACTSTSRPVFLRALVTTE